MRIKNISAVGPECRDARRLPTLGWLAVLNVQKRSACIRAGGIVDISAARPGVWGCPPLTPIWVDLSVPSVGNARTLIPPPDPFAKMVTPRSTVFVAQNDGRTASPGVFRCNSNSAAGRGCGGVPHLPPSGRIYPPRSTQRPRRETAQRISACVKWASQRNQEVLHA